jgi:hypothetical protein
VHPANHRLPNGEPICDPCYRNWLWYVRWQTRGKSANLLAESEYLIMLQAGWLSWIVDGQIEGKPTPRNLSVRRSEASQKGGRAAWGRKTPEERMAHVLNMAAGQTLEGRKAAGRKGGMSVAVAFENATPEERVTWLRRLYAGRAGMASEKLAARASKISAAMKVHWANMTQEERRADAAIRWPKRTTEERSELGRKSYSTRLANGADPIEIRNHLQSLRNNFSVEQRREASRKGGQKAGIITQAKRTPEERSIFARKANASVSAEQRSARNRKAMLTRYANMTSEERSEMARKRMANIPPEARSAAVRNMWAKKTPEERSAVLRKANASRTPEQRSEASRKANTKANAEERRLRSIKYRLIQISNTTQEERSASTRRGAHNRWHASRGIINLKCVYCIGVLEG